VAGEVHAYHTEGAAFTHRRKRASSSEKEKTTQHIKKSTSYIDGLKKDLLSTENKLRSQRGHPKENLMIGERKENTQRKI